MATGLSGRAHHGDHQAAQGRAAVGQEATEERLPGKKGRARAQQDVAGSLKTDRQNLRTAELEQLFKVCVILGTCLTTGLCKMSAS